jgi:hypothetical protein
MQKMGFNNAGTKGSQCPVQAHSSQQPGTEGSQLGKSVEQ